MSKDNNSDCMNNLNSVLIEGTLADDPKCRTTPKGTPVGTFDIVSYRCERDPDAPNKRCAEVSQFTVEVWGTLAQATENLGKKGRGVRVVGRLREYRWQGARGKQESKVVVIAEHVEYRPEFKVQVNQGSTKGEK